MAGLCAVGVRGCAVQGPYFWVLGWSSSVLLRQPVERDHRTGVQQALRWLHCVRELPTLPTGMVPSVAPPPQSLFPCCLLPLCGILLTAARMISHCHRPAPIHVVERVCLLPPSPPPSTPCAVHRYVCPPGEATSGRRRRGKARASRAVTAEEEEEEEEDVDVDVEAEEEGEGEALDQDPLAQAQLAPSSLKPATATGDLGTLQVCV